MKEKGKHNKKEKSNKKLKIIILIIFIIVFVICIGYIGYYLYNNYKCKYDAVLSEIEIDTTQITEQKTERMLQLEELQNQNNEIIGWLEIEGTNINYPVCQTTDNDYYLTHNYKKEKATGGNPFLDKDYDFSIPSSNLLIYGHRNKLGLMFEDLIKYTKEDFYKEHTKIRFTTINDDSTYEILAVFYSRVYYKDEQNVFRYYYFVNAENEEEYNNFVEESKKASIYDTNVTAKYGDQLLTLSTCEYSQEDGRFVVVARKTK